MSVPNPFAVHEPSLSRTPWDAEDTQTPWQCITSYAWLIFLHASKCADARKSAGEWGRAFESMFTQPYVNDVLPLFDKHADGEIKLATHVVSWLSTVLFAIQNMHHDPTGAVIEQLAYIQPETLRTELKLPSFMTDRPACAAVWVQLIKGDLRSGREFFHFSTGGVGPTEENGVLTDKGRRYKAGRELTSWVRETRNYLGRFDTSGSHSATYAGLSQRLRKFYHELRETAMLVGQNGWRYGFLFIMFWPVRRVLKHVISGFEDGEDGINRVFQEMRTAHHVNSLKRQCHDAVNAPNSKYHWLALPALAPPPPPAERSGLPPHTHAGGTLRYSQELGQMGLRRFHGPIGRRSARRYGIDPRDAWN